MYDAGNFCVRSEFQCCPIQQRDRIVFNLILWFEHKNNLQKPTMFRRSPDKPFFFAHILRKRHLGVLNHELRLFWRHVVFANVVAVLVVPCKNQQLKYTTKFRLGKSLPVGLC
jgi:hypothetical protein